MEDENRRFLDLLATSEVCRRIHDEYEQMAPDAWFDEHPPEAMLARWKTAKRDLGTVEWTLLRKHVEACTECREDIRTLGLGPVQESLPEQGAGRVPSPQAGAGVLPPANGPERNHRAAWALAAWATVATAAAIVLLLADPRRFDRPERLAEHSSIVPWVEPQLVRGTGASALLVLPHGARRLLLPILVPPQLQAEDSITVTVASPSGTNLHHEEIGRDAIRDGRLMLLVRSEAPLPAGTYRVRLAGKTAVESGLEFELLFSLAHTPQP